MLTLVNDIVGKTIKSSVNNGNDLVILFTDGTYCHYCVKHYGLLNGYGLSINHPMAVNSGVYTQDEIDAWCIERDAKAELNRKGNDLINTIIVLRAEGIPCDRHLDELQRMVDAGSEWSLSKRAELTEFIRSVSQ